MNCCIDCFCDSQIRLIIDKLNQFGDCDFCGKKNTKSYPVTGSGDIEALLGKVIDIYSVAEPCIGGKMMNTALHEDWNIFNVAPNLIQELMKVFCVTHSERSSQLFTSPVVIPECNDEDYLSTFSITRGKSWNEFAEAIKYQNRFYNRIFNPDALASFLSYSVKSYPADTVMYRARVSKDKRGFARDEMGAPPREKRTAGRVNPEGVGVLYLSSKNTTALYEIRSNLYDYVTIGAFKLLRDIRVVNLAGNQFN